MLSLDQIKQRALRKYWDFLHSIAAGTPFFPLVLAGSGHSRIDDFGEVRSAIAVLRQQSKEGVGFGYEIEWQERSFRRFAAQKLPAKITFSSRDDFTKFIGKEREVAQFESDYHLIKGLMPELLPWAIDNPRVVIENAGQWTGLLAVCSHLRTVGRPGCYLRELPVPVPTKFIEQNKAVLSLLLPIAAPDCESAGATSFEERFGFKRKPVLIRFRFLDEALRARMGFGFRDMAIGIEDFCALNLDTVHALVVENEMTFLTLPVLPDTVAVLGSGDTVASLGGARWLATSDLRYWGDMDTHGFEALAFLRRAFPQTKSILMDAVTFAAFQEFAVPACPYSSREPLGLTDPERTLFNRLLADSVLLEQEHIPPMHAAARLTKEIGGYPSTKALHGGASDLC